MDRDSRKLKRLLEADGWQLVATVGSHHQYKHPIKPGKLTLPHPKRDLPIGTVRAIYRAAGLTDKGLG